MTRPFIRNRPRLVRPSHPLPHVRHLSPYATWLLARTPASANQITLLSLVFGLVGAWFLAAGDYDNGLIGAAWIVGCYILDNSDGEIARIKSQSSTFGMQFDTFVDFIVHVAVFLAIGVGHARMTGAIEWTWLGWIAAAAMIGNYASGLIATYRRRPRNSDHDPTGRSVAEASARPGTVCEWTLFVFREAFRADFCFILLAFALADQVWFLLPACALGAPVYWATRFARGVDKFHV